MEQDPAPQSTGPVWGQPPRRRRPRPRGRALRAPTLLREGDVLVIGHSALQLRSQPVAASVPVPAQRRSGRVQTLTVLSLVLVMVISVVATALMLRRSLSAPSASTTLPLGLLTGVPMMALMLMRLLTTRAPGRRAQRQPRPGRRHPPGAQRRGHAGRGRRGAHAGHGRRTPGPPALPSVHADSRAHVHAPLPHGAAPGAGTQPSPSQRRAPARTHLGWWGRHPDGSSMLLALAGWAMSPAAAVTVHGDGSGTGAPPPLAAWAGPRRRGNLLTVRPGSVVALTGASSQAWLTWWAAQVIASGQVGTAYSWSADRMTLTVPLGSPSTTTAPAPASVTACTGASLPARTTIVHLAPPGPAPVSARWFRAAHTAMDLARRTAGSPTNGPTPSRATTDQSGLPRTVHLRDVIGPCRRDDIMRRWDRYDRARHAGAGPGVPATIAVGADLGQGRPPDVTGSPGADEPGRVDSASRASEVGVADRASGRRAVVVDLVAHGPHALVAGTTGSGKSDLLTSWILQLAVTVPPDQLSLVLVDYKGGAAFAALADLPHTAGVLTDLDPALTLRALSSLRAEVVRRERVLAANGVKDARRLDAAQALPTLVIVVDEFATLAQSHPDVLDALVRVAAQGRSLGLHLILATQRPAGAVSAPVRANTSLRVCLRVLDESDSRDVLGTACAAHLEAWPGRVAVTDASGRIEVAQAPWCGQDSEVAAMVAAVAAAQTARSQQGHASWRPWAPPLPARVSRPPVRTRPRSVPSASDSAHREQHTDPADGVPLAVLDEPDQQRTRPWQWDPTTPLLVLAAPGSGRTTALLSAALGVLASDGQAHVHLVGPSRQWEQAGSLRRGGARVGTVVGPDDPRRLARLWDLMARGTLAGDLVVIDDITAAMEAVDTARGPGAGASTWETLCRQAGALGVGLAVGASLACASARWAQSLPLRLVLGATQAEQAALAGLPHSWRCGRQPGRGVLLTPIPYACQVYLPRADELEPASTAGLPAPVSRRLEPIPLHPRADAWAVGGDQAQPLPPPTSSVLVVGPPGSGRSTAVTALARAVASSRDPAHGAPVVVDDLDLADAEVTGEVSRALEQGLQVIAGATTSAAAAGYQGPLARLRTQAALVILWPHLTAPGALTPVDLRPACDPAHPVHPGRGVLVLRGTATPLQVVDPAHRTARA